MPSKILVVDDENDIRRLISEILSDEGYEPIEAASSEEALEVLECEALDLMILDIWLEGSELDGIELLKKTHNLTPELPIIMISGHGDIETAVNTIKLGAYDFIEKPFETDRILVMIERALDAVALRKENAELRRKRDSSIDLVGVSSAINETRILIDRVAQMESRLLISGPPGVGKEVVARLIHNKSKRQGKSFVVMNCATMAPERMEEELFGVEVNTDGDRSSQGIFEQANGGTLLLDEVSDMPLVTQGKIARVLQEQTFNRVGGTTSINVDVRVLATTNKNLLEMIDLGSFREDLFYRLNVVPINLLPLKQRPTDVSHLAEYFMNRASEETGIPARKIGEDAMAVLRGYDWPGNARQLRNVIEWLLIMVNGSMDQTITKKMLPPEVLSQSPRSVNLDKDTEIMSMPLRNARELFEREYLKSQVDRFDGNVSKTARFVGMERSALHRKLKSLGIITS